MRKSAPKKYTKKADASKVSPEKKDTQDATETDKKSTEVVKSVDHFEAMIDMGVKNIPAAKPSQAKGLNGFYPAKPSKHVNQHVRVHHLISQPRKITHSKLGRVMA